MKIFHKHKLFFIILIYILYNINIKSSKLVPIIKLKNYGKRINKSIKTINNSRKFIKTKKHGSKQRIYSMLKYYENFIKNIPNYNHTHILNDVIQWCWLQGLEKVPKLYKATFKSVKNICKTHNIIIINNTNLNNYVKFPSFIIEKRNNKIIDNKHFSEIRIIN